MFIAFPAPRNHLSTPLCLCYTSFCSGHLQVAPPPTRFHFFRNSQIAKNRQSFSDAKTCKPFPNSLYYLCCKSIAPFFRAPPKFLGLLRRRGHVFYDNPA